jgi:hypothetical protein
MTSSYLISKAKVIGEEGDALGEFTGAELYEKCNEGTLNSPVYYWAPGMRMWMSYNFFLQCMSSGDGKHLIYLDGDGDMILYGEMPDKPVSKGQRVSCAPAKYFFDYEMAVALITKRLPSSARIVRFPKYSISSEEIFMEKDVSENIKFIGYASWVEFVDIKNVKVRDEWVVYCCEYGREPLVLWIGSRDCLVHESGSRSLVDDARAALERGELRAFVRQQVLKSREKPFCETNDHQKTSDSATNNKIKRESITRPNSFLSSFTQLVKKLLKFLRKK